MKVVFVHKSTLGATGDAAMHYYPAILAKAGHDVTMLAQEGGNASALKASGVDVVEIPRGRSWTNGVVDVVVGKQPDIIHVFLYSGCGILPYLLRTKCRSRFVLDIRSPLLRRGVARCLHRLKNYIEPIGYDVVSAHGIDSARTQVGRFLKLEFLPPGVDFSIVPVIRHDTAESREDGDPLRLVYIGSLDPLRRLDLLLHAVSRATKACLIELDIYGDGAGKPVLESIVRDLGLEKQVRFKGTLGRHMLFEELRTYDLGISYIPHGMYDTAPALKTLEYLACGLPVLATNTSGNKMFVKDQFNGFLVEGNPEAFARALIDLSASDRPSKLKNTTQVSVSGFDWSRIVQDRLIPLYQKLIA